MKKLKCEHCIHKKVCIDGANYRNAEECRNFINENDIVVVKHAQNLAKYFGEIVCSACGIHLDETARIIEDEFTDDKHYYDFQPRFCPNCGAVMINSR